MLLKNQSISQARRIVIKVGTSTLTYNTGRINLRRIESLVRTISDLRHAGKDVVLVTSGAVGVGMSKLGFHEKPRDIKGKQATSAVGQSELMSIYGKFFAEYGCDVAQILLTKNIIEDEVRKNNAINTFHTLLEWGVIPIVNENDTISTEEIEFGDNDTLSAVVAGLLQADLLIILSDIDGLYDADPRSNPEASLIHTVTEVTDDLMLVAGGSGSKVGTGGMITKLIAARLATEKGVHMVIANGVDPKVIYHILDGEQVGTLFKAKEV